MLRSYHDNKSDIKKIFKEAPSLEISVKNLVRRITELDEYDDKFWDRHNSICRTIRCLESSDKPFLETKFFNIYPRRFGPFVNNSSSRIKMVRLWKPSGYRHWKIESDEDEYIKQQL